jgi:hypothetical protein
MNETSRYVFRIMALKEIMNSPTMDLMSIDRYELIPTRKNWNRYVHNWFGSFAKAQGINYKILKIHNPCSTRLRNATNKIHNRNSIKQLLIWNRLSMTKLEGSIPAL